jgi:hypothetical protein
MSNVLKNEKKQQIIALDDWAGLCERFKRPTRVRRETISTYRRGASVEVRPHGKMGRTSKAAIGVITDFGVGLSSKETEKRKGVGSVSRCEPYREIIELGSYVPFKFSCRVSL